MERAKERADGSAECAGSEQVVGGRREANGVAGRPVGRLKNSTKSGKIDGEWTAKCDAEREASGW